MSSNGTVLNSEIIGAIKMKSFLSGMPELKLGLNDKLMFEATGRPQSKGKAVELEDIKFHQCVRLARFENDRTISFIPPDGEFDLMNYRLRCERHRVRGVHVAVSVSLPAPSPFHLTDALTPLPLLICLDFTVTPART